MSPSPPSRPTPPPRAHTCPPAPTLSDSTPLTSTSSSKSRTPSTLTRGPSVSISTPNGDQQGTGPTVPGEGAPVMRQPSLSSHPLFAAKARGLRNRVLRFTPSWFIVTMGTGIVNTLLFDLPWQASHPAFRAIGSAFLILDIALFLAFSFITILRYALHPAIFLAMLKNETHSLFLGTIPMGLVTIMSGIARTGTEYGISWALEVGLIGWWVSLVMSIMTAFVVPFVMFTKHNHTTEALTAAWLLPVVPAITIAAVGPSLARLLITERNDLRYALTVLIASYINCGVGLLLACGIMTIYFQRLAVHHLPPREVIVSTFLPLGPCGQAGFALIELGRVATILFPLLASTYPDRPGVAELATLGPPLVGAGLMTGLLLWGLGIWWTFIAVGSVATHYFGKQIMFNMGWWAFTFPLGSMTLLTFSLGSIFDSLFFNVIAALFTFCVTLLWSIVFFPTAVGFLRGTLFPAPCLNSLPTEYVEKVAKKVGAAAMLQPEEGERRREE